MKETFLKLILFIFITYKFFVKMIYEDKYVRKNIDPALQKFGLNWQKFKNLNVNSTGTEQCSKNNQNKKKKRTERSSKIHYESVKHDKNNLEPTKSIKNRNSKVPPSNNQLTKNMSMDCETVGIGNSQGNITQDSIVNKGSLKKLSDQINRDKTKDISSIRKNTDSALRIPGLNWQRFKNLSADATGIDQCKDNQNRIKKRNQRSYQYGREHIDNNQEIAKTVTNKSIKVPSANHQLTKVIAMDCEMVGIGNGQESMIARVSIVNRYGHCVYDKYVKPTEVVQDYRTAVSGIRPHNIENGYDFKIVQKEVSDILKKRILVGHALYNDLAVLFLSHPKYMQRDTSKYKLFLKVTKGKTPSLKKLSSELLGVDIQSGEHNSIEDAQATMQLYMLFRKQWENDIKKKNKIH